MTTGVLARTALLVLAATLWLPAQSGLAAQPKDKRVAIAPRDGQAEARLIEIYKLIGQAKTRPALALAEKLVTDHPNFQ